MMCVFSDKGKIRIASGWIGLAVLLAAAGAQSWAAPLSIKAGAAQFAIDAQHGSLVSAQLGGQLALAECVDEYWLQNNKGEIVQRTNEQADRVLSQRRQGHTLMLRCRNEALGVEIIKSYAPGPLPDSLRKTVHISPFAQEGLLHVFSRVRLAAPLANTAWLYTPRQSWGGQRLLYGVRPLGEIKEPMISSSGWDNRFVVAFRPDRTLAVAHWRSEVDGVWIPYSGVVTEWGRESPFALTYFPDGWRFRLLFCPERRAASATAEYVLHRGDWYDSWALYQSHPGYQKTFADRAEIPQWCRQVKYGAFWQPPDYESPAAQAAQMAERLGPDAYVTLGVFGWSLDGDYETERPFLTETLALVLTPDYLRRCIAALQAHPRVKVGLYIQGGLIDEQSQCYRDHPDWVVRDPDGQPVDSGFADNSVGRMFMANGEEAWRRHHFARIAAVCRAYDCGWIYLDGGGYGEGFDWPARRLTTFVDCLEINRGVLQAVRSTGRERGLLINSQNMPFGDMSWLECPYFEKHISWRETMDFCFDTEVLHDPRHTLQPLYWRDERYLPCCIAFGFTPCTPSWGETEALNDTTFRAIEAAYRMKTGQLILNSQATAPVWWRDNVPIVTFAERVGRDIVVPIFNFGEQEQIEIAVDLAAVGLQHSAARLRATAYRPMLSAEKEDVSLQPAGKDRVKCILTVPRSWKGLTLLTLSP